MGLGLTMKGLVKPGKAMLFHCLDSVRGEVGSMTGGGGGISGFLARFRGGAGGRVIKPSLAKCLKINSEKY